MEIESAIAVMLALSMAPVGALLIALYIIASIVDMVQRAAHNTEVR